MKTCPYCRKSIDVAAVKCAFCGTTFCDSEMEEGRREYARKRWGNFGLAVLAVVAIFWWLNQPGNVEWLGQQAAEHDAIDKDVAN